MANKPTSLASLVAKQADDAAKAAEAEDATFVARKAPKGKVWVRLIRPHYDAEGFHHDIGIALLNEGAVPSSAKRLAEPAADAEDDE